MDFSSLIALLALSLLFFAPPVVIVSSLPGGIVAAFLALSGVPMSTLSVLVCVLSFAAIPIAWVFVGGFFEQMLLGNQEALLQKVLPIIALFFIAEELLTGEAFPAIVDIYVGFDPTVLTTLLLHVSAESVRWICLLSLGYALASFLWSCVSTLSFPESPRSAASLVYVGVIPLGVLVLALTIEQLTRLCLLELLGAR